MFVRRLIFLFVLMALGGGGADGAPGAVAIGGGQDISAQAENLIKRHFLIETSRGPFLTAMGGCWHRMSRAMTWRLIIALNEPR